MAQERPALPLEYTIHGEWKDGYHRFVGRTTNWHEALGIAVAHAFEHEAWVHVNRHTRIEGRLPSDHTTEYKLIEIGPDGKPALIRT